MKYEKFQYIKPLRAETAVPVDQLSSFEDGNWLAQFKKNGTNNMIFVAPDKTLQAFNRHEEKQKLWNFSEASGQAFRSLPGSGWYVLNAELMHSKTTNIKDTNYIHDILVADGEWLFGKTYQDRYEILCDLFLSQAEGKVTKTHVEINSSTWLARNYHESFGEMFRSISTIEDEGLVLKKHNTPYFPRMAAWTYKCRKKHKNYSF